MPPDPRNDVRRHVHGRGAPGRDQLMAHTGHAATASRSVADGDASTRFRAPILHREDVECLGRKPEAGGTPTPPGVEFVRYRRSYGLGFRQTAPKRPRMAVEGGLPGSTGCGGSRRPPLSARTPPTRGSSPRRRSQPSSRLAGTSRIPPPRFVGYDGAAPGRGTGNGPPGVALRPPRRPRSQGGQRGQSPPPASAGDSRSVAPRSKLARLQ